MSEAMLVSAGAIVLAEMGDKTQLLAIMLAARYRNRFAIVLGIALATLISQAIAAGLGGWITSLVSPGTLRWVVALSFLGMAVWMLFPDGASDFQGSKRLGVFGTSLLAFFLVELGDKSQAATLALAAHYGSFVDVLIGTTAGMLIANVPLVYAGEALMKRLPLRPLQYAAAALFAGLGIWVLLA
jgi:putative Ca2+/H+ antiporter (TMEM165/GDT1 family)